MKLAMSAGQLAAEMRAVRGDLSVIVEEGDSRLAVADLAAGTVTIFAPKAKKAAKPKDPEPAAPIAAPEPVAEPGA